VNGAASLGADDAIDMGGDADPVGGREHDADLPPS